MKNGLGESRNGGWLNKLWDINEIKCCVPMKKEGGSSKWNDCMKCNHSVWAHLACLLSEFGVLGHLVFIVWKWLFIYFVQFSYLMPYVLGGLSMLTSGNRNYSQPCVNSGLFPLLLSCGSCTSLFSLHTHACSTTDLREDSADLWSSLFV